MPRDYECILCRKTLTNGPGAHRLDPCALTLTVNVHLERRHQREQTFFCHYTCFRDTVNRPGLMYIEELGTAAAGDGDNEPGE